MEIFQMFGDESGTPSEDFQSVSIVSGKKTDINDIRKELDQVIQYNEIKELKWTKINTHSNTRKTAKEFVKTAIDYLSLKKIRIDVLYWDINDSRHRIKGRDDISNLERMYYKIIRWVVDIWGDKDCIWEIYPDQNSALNWPELKDYLKKTKFRTYNKPGLIRLFEDKNTSPMFPVSTIQQKESDKESLIQLADFFAGISRFSKMYGGEYFKWLENENSKNKLMLFERNHIELNSLSKKRKARFQILKYLDELCKEKKLQVSLEHNGYLLTMKKSNPLNFWFYQPQTEMDKAPIKLR